ncbi:unnamed protein product [Sphagnum jensenii]|uniref:Protein kinase domain-containing protein n=1 Tax=Sphagnum jensenii TaxID=128206 RepID=A0ABP1BEN4_9BRYO
MARLLEWRIAVGLMVHFAVLVHYAHFARPQPGFISIDCGSTANFTDPVTNIQWVPDAGYIGVGANFLNVPLNGLTDITLSTLRYFPPYRRKFCYTLPATLNTTYLIRAQFHYGNYDGTNSPPNFQISIDSTIISSPLFKSSAYDPVVAEATVIAQSDQLFFCLLPNSTSDVPFINSLELRNLGINKIYDNLIYNGPYYLENVVTYNFGSNETVRFPDDPYDRIWVAQGTEGYQVLSTTSSINVSGYNRDEAPTKVLQTAQYWNTSVNLTFTNRLATEDLYYVVSLFFAEIESFAATARRNMVMKAGTLNQIEYLDVYNLVGSDTVVEYGWNSATLNSTDTLSLSTTRFSLSGPTLNALAINRIYLPSQLTTNLGDVNAIQSFKSSIGLDSWSGDPCYPVPYDWVNCTVNATNGVRISSIKLSSMKLTGSIPTSLSSLEGLTTLFLDNNYLNGGIPNQLSSLINLEQLHLQNNNLSGPFPLWATNLTQLEELYLQNNNLIGEVPSLSAFANSSIQILTFGNQLLCNASGCATTTSSHSKFPIAIVVGVVVGVITVVVILIIIIACLCQKDSCVRQNPPPKDQNPPTDISPLNPPLVFPDPDQVRAYSYDQVRNATNDFANEIGSGGFGHVYRGTLGDDAVAVKVSKTSNRLDFRQFEVEVRHLSRVRHNNLVRLIGYCEHMTKLILIYEYMERGSCHDLLHGEERNRITLDWETRLSIAIDAAQGLEYLHKFAKPKIIHRDIKTANILLNERMEAKLSDFGISRPILEGGQPPTQVMGSLGYVDPEYRQTENLTEKVDIFSFGVVLLEFISGKHPLNRPLVDWVRTRLDARNITDVIDESFGLDYNVDSIQMVGKIAKRCVNPNSEDRPTMTVVLQELHVAKNTERPESSNGRHHAPSAPTSEVELPTISSDLL